jgi:hypothetical protein
MTVESWVGHVATFNYIALLRRHCVTAGVDRETPYEGLARKWFNRLLHYQSPSRSKCAAEPWDVAE